MAVFTPRPAVSGQRGVVTSGHYLATEAGLRIFHEGGNAIDAGAAMCFCLNILEPFSNGIGGEAPTLIYSARDRKAYAVSGMGWCPQALTIEWCREHGVDLIPHDGYLPACVPAVVDTWAAALIRFGTMSMAQVLRPAIEYARDGYPIYPRMHDVLIDHQEKFTDRYPTSGAVYLPEGRVPQVGEIIRNPDWAAALQTMCDAERDAQHQGRTAGIEAARDCFYRGPIAERIVEFITSHPVEDETGKSHTGLLSYDDIAEWRATIEEPIVLNFRGLDVHKCPTWTQGPVFLQQLALLDGFDLNKLGHNSAKYLHTLIECAKLAFADREAYYGDPSFDDVPYDLLLSPQYNNERRKLTAKKASKKFRPSDARYATFDVVKAGEHSGGHGHAHLGDTTHLDAVDAEGNMVASTPSGGWLGTSPIIEGLGFPLGTRGQMFYLNPDRPNALQPRKRPRATLTPSLVTQDGKPFMVFGTPGGDCQDQWTLQFFLNHVVFGMELQQAVDAPTVHTLHFPSSFYPRQAYPGRMDVENRLDSKVIKKLKKRGHEVLVNDAWANGKPMAIRIDQKSGVITGAVSQRGIIGYAGAW